MAGKRHPVRTYAVDGRKLPSVTSILSRTDAIAAPSRHSSLEWWRSKEPNHRRILDDACRRGSIIHSEIEVALTGKSSAEFTMDEWTDFNIPGYMTHLLPLVQELGEGEVEVEKVVFSLAYGYAGTADLVAEYDGLRTIVDWKTTRKGEDTGYKEKKRSHYKNAEMQIAAYAAAYNEDRRNPPIQQGLVVVAYDWREPELIKLDQDQLISRAIAFEERLKLFKILEGNALEPVTPEASVGV